MNLAGPDLTRFRARGRHDLRIQLCHGIWFSLALAACSVRSATFTAVDDGGRAVDAPLPPCDEGITGRLRGTVFAPNGTLPLAGVTVYVAGSDPGPLSTVPDCNRCGALSGDPIVTTTTDASGAFVLDGVPVGDVRVVITTGKWRRQVVVPGVTVCSDTALDPTTTRLPRNQLEGDVPRIAVQAASDPLECLLVGLGVDSSEMTTDTGTGRIHLYTTASSATTALASGPILPATTTLTADPVKLAGYDLLLFGCEAKVITRATADAQNLVDYTTAGGRMLLDHYGGTWFAAAPAPWPSLGTFDPTLNPSDPRGVLTVDRTTPPNESFAQWLYAVGGSTTPGVLSIATPRHGFTSVDTTVARSMLVLDPSNNPQIPIRDVSALELATPIGQSACGRIAFTDIHSATAVSNGMPFPLECIMAPLTPNQLALAYLVFDVGACTR